MPTLDPEFYLDTEPSLDDASSDSHDAGDDADTTECPPLGVYNPFGLATDIEHRLAGAVRDFARCGGELLVDHGFFNHGRSVDRKPENARHRRVVPNELRAADVPYAVWSDAASRVRGGGTFVARAPRSVSSRRPTRSIWGRTSNALGDLLGLQAGNVGGPSANPRCAFGRFTVHGM